MWLESGWETLAWTFFGPTINSMWRTYVAVLSVLFGVGLMTKMWSVYTVQGMGSELTGLHWSVSISYHPLTEGLVDRSWLGCPGSYWSLSQLNLTTLSKLCQCVRADKITNVAYRTVSGPSCCNIGWSTHTLAHHTIYSGPSCCNIG